MKKIKKLGFSTETVRNLAPATLTQVGGGGPYTINITCDASGCGCVPTRMYTCRCPTAATC